MRKFSLLAAAVVMLSAGAAHGGALTSATWFGSFQGTPFTLSTGGAGLTATGSAIGTTANVSLSIAPTLFTTLDTTGTAPVFISQTLGGSQTITIGGGGTAANQGIAGVVNVFIGNDNTGLFLFSVPLTVGVTPGGGNPFFTITTTVPGLAIPVSVTASAFAWQTSPFTFNGSTVSGAPVGTPFASTGSNGLAGGVGTVTLIAPAIQQVCAGSIASPFPCNGGSQKSTSAGVTKLVLNFPEPGTALLLGAGLLGLAAVGRRQRS